MFIGLSSFKTIAFINVLIIFINFYAYFTIELKLIGLPNKSL